MATVTWLLLREFLPAIITALLFVLYLVAIRKLVVKVQPLNISYPSFPQKMIYWKELSNVILKEGLLTIDFKSNKLIQQVIEENKSYVNEQEFNDFCKSMLKEKGGIDRIKADHC